MLSGKPGLVHIEEAVPAEAGHDLAVLAVDIGFDKKGGADLVVVHVVPGRVLEVPLQFARIGVEGDGGIGVEVVTRPIFRVIHGNRVAGTPEDKVRIRVVGAWSCPGLVPVSFEQYLL